MWLWCVASLGLVGLTSRDSMRERHHQNLCCLLGDSMEYRNEYTE